MVALQRIFIKAYWTLASIGIAWAVCVVLLLVPSIQRQYVSRLLTTPCAVGDRLGGVREKSRRMLADMYSALYAHKFQSSFFGNVSNPEEFGFAKGQVQPFLLETADHEKLFCWHVIPLDIYLEHENELIMAAGSGEVAEELRGTVGEKLLSGDGESRVVVNFHGNAGHIAQSSRPQTYRSITSIPKTHLLTCSYRGFGSSTLLNAPHLPTETGLITDAISLLSYLRNDLSHPEHRTVLLGQSLGTAVTAAVALWRVDPTSQYLPSDLPFPTTSAAKPDSDSEETGFAGIVLVSPFRDLPSLLRTYKIGGLIPVLKPLAGYPRIANFVNSRILDTWATLPRLLALVSAHTHDSSPSSSSSSTAHEGGKTRGLRLHLIHARNDQAITFRESEALYAPLQSALLALEGASASEERRSIHGGERVKRGAFAYRKVEVETEKGEGKGGVSVEMEVVRFGGHNDVVGWSAVGLGVRRAFARAG